jgi:hypothetical protein
MQTGWYDSGDNLRFLDSRRLFGKDSFQFLNMSDPEPNTAPTAVLHPDQQEISQVLRSLKLDMEGIFHLGNDGVLRSLTADRAVIDAIPLPPNLIKAFLDRNPFDQELEDLYRGVDGTTVPRDQWFHPDPSLLDEPLTEEERVEEERQMAIDKELIRKAKEGSGKEERSACVPIIRSNYNLDKKSKDGDGDT